MRMLNTHELTDQSVDVKSGIDIIYLNLFAYKMTAANSFVMYNELRECVYHSHD